MKASELFEKYIGKELKPLIIQFDPYNDTFKTYPYRHITESDFEKNFSDLMFKNIVFYSYEPSEIEYNYSRGKLDDLTKFARMAYEKRVPKTERPTDGLLGELALDSFIKVFFPHIEMTFSRVKYLDRFPKKEIPKDRKGKEVKGYDSILFSYENGQRYVWLGQVKTGDWNYCLSGIKSDISKSILKNYFSSAMVIVADIMTSSSSNSPEIQYMIDGINDITYENPKNLEKQYDDICRFFRSNNIIVRIPCLIIADEKDYSDGEKLLKIIKDKCHSAFQNFTYKSADIPTEIYIMVLPVRDLNKIRTLFLEERTENGY